MATNDDKQPESDLHILDYWRVIRSRKEIIFSVILLIVLTGIAYTLTLPKIFMANARISVSEDSLDVSVFERQGVPFYNPYFLRTQFQIIQSRPMLMQVVKNLNLQQLWTAKYAGEGQQLSVEDARRILAGSINVDQTRDTSLIEIRVKREDPAEAARIANELASVYREHRLSLKRGTLRRALDAMESELVKQEEKVRQAEDELEKLRKDLGVHFISRGIHADKMRLSSMESDRMSARVDMLVRKARLEQLAELTGDELVNAVTYVVSDAAVINLRKSLTDAQISLRVKLESLGSNHPEVRQLQAGADEISISLKNAIEGVKAGLKADYEVAKARYDAIEKELVQVRERDIESERDKFLPFDKAEQNLNVNRQILDALRARVAQQSIEQEVPRTPVEIIDPAEAPSRPVSPNMMMNIVVSIVLGIVAGIGLAYFIEYLDTSVKTVDDVERHLGAPVLGVIPQKTRSLMEEGPESPHAEAYRVLRTNMQFANKGVVGGAFACMSGGVGEGKSTTLFNLAFVCAQMGDKVLIVDSDMRRPVQHTFLGMPNTFGLTNVLVRDVPVEEAIKATSIPNLHILPSGRLPKSSIGLLDSQRMRELVKNLKVRYDYVFFDSPPIVGVSDASILASEVDAVLLVVQYRKYPRTMSSRAKRMLENVGANILGVVLNNINIMRDDYYYYYHSYYSYYEKSNESKLEEEALASTRKTEESV